MKDFDMSKYLKENNLGSYGILNHYIDIEPLKEESSEEGAYEEASEEIPYVGDGKNQTGLGGGDTYTEPETISEAPNRIEWKDLDDSVLEDSGMEVEIDDLINDAQYRIEHALANDPIVSQLNRENPKQAEAQIRVLIKRLWLDKIKQWRG